MSPLKILKSETGAVLVVSLVMLVILTIIGVAATNTSVLEILISNSHKKKQAAFYSAEAGLEHAKVKMSGILDENTVPINNGEGDIAQWAFLFDDTTPVKDENGNTMTLNDVPTSAAEYEYEGQKYLLPDVAFGNHKYSVSFYDPEYPNDTDGIIWVRSEGTGPNGGKAIVEVSYLGQYTLKDSNQMITDYSAQDKQGASKASSGKDTAAIAVSLLGNSEGTGTGTTQLNRTY